MFLEGEPKYAASDVFISFIYVIIPCVLAAKCYPLGVLDDERKTIIRCQLCDTVLFVSNSEVKIVVIEFFTIWFHHAANVEGLAFHLDVDRGIPAMG